MWKIPTPSIDRRMVNLLGSQVQLFLIFVYTLPLFCIAVFNSDRINDVLSYKDNKLIRVGWTMVLGLVYVWVSNNRFTADAIKTHHIETYIILLFIAKFFLESSYSPIRVICLSIMLVFVNSYYWELPYHLFKVVNSGVDLNDLQQLLHLYPLVYLKDALRFHNIRLTKKYILSGLALNIAIVMIRLQFFGWVWKYNIGFMFILRIVNLVVLLLAFYTTEKKDNRTRVY